MLILKLDEIQKLSEYPVSVFNAKCEFSGNIILFIFRREIVSEDRFIQVTRMRLKLRTFVCIYI